MSEYEMFWSVFHVLLGFLSWSGIVYLLAKIEPKPSLLMPALIIEHRGSEEYRGIMFLSNYELLRYKDTSYLKNKIENNEWNLLKSLSKQPYSLKTVVEDDYMRNGKVIISSIRIVRER